MTLRKLINDPIFILITANFFLSLLANLITDFSGIKMHFGLGTIAGAISYHQILRWNKENSQ